MDFRLTVPSLANNCWPAQPQTLINEAWEKTRGELEDITGVIISTTQPAVDDQDKMWIRVDGNGRANGQFVFGGGSWSWKNEEEALSSVRRFHVGSESDVWSYDGGDGSNPSTSIPTATTGAMWEVDHDFDGRSPMAPGTIPDSSPSKVLSVNENYGSGVHLQDPEEVAPHSHPLTADASITNSGNIKVVTSGSGGSGLLVGNSGTASTDISVLDNEFSSTQEAMSIVPPVRGIYLIKRTGRTHYTP